MSTSLKESYEEVKDGPFEWSNTYYLSPDADEALLDFDDNANFVIGGLIDRTVVRYASLE